MFGLGSIASKVFGSSNDRKVKKYQSRVDEINALEPELAALSDDELRARTEPRWMICWFRLSQRSARRPNARWACVTLTCSWLAAWS